MGDAEPTTAAARGRYCNTFLVKHEDRFFLFSETGDLILAGLSPEGYREFGRFRVLEPTNPTFGRPVVWTHRPSRKSCSPATTRNWYESVGGG